MVSPKGRTLASLEQLAGLSPSQHGESPNEHQLVELEEEVRLRTTRLTDVISEQVKPLWPKRIFRDKLAVMAGDPGVGKSYASLDIAARVSLGGPWPDGSGIAPKGNVLLLSAEDGLADTVKPRLALLGADMSRIFSLGLTACKGDEEVGISLQQHVSQIEQEIVEKEIILMVVDPLLAFTGKADTHNSSDVRALLSPLAAMAERTGCAILAVMHPNKNSSEGNLLYRISASLDFAAAARSVMVVAKHPDNPDQRVMVTVKCNLSAHPEPIAFGFTHDGCFAWQGVTEVDMSQIMAPLDREDSSAKDDAKRFLEEVLADGEMAFNDVMKEARECGISERTLRRAAGELGVHMARIGEPGKRGGGKWWWRLSPREKDLDGQPPCGTVGHLNQSRSNERSVSTEQEGIIKMANGHVNPEHDGHVNPEHDGHVNPQNSSTDSDEPIKMANSAAQDLAILINDSSEDGEELVL